MSIDMSRSLKPWPKPFKYELSKEHVWVSEQPCSTEDLLLYERARADAAIARLKVARDALETLAAQHSGTVGSTRLADCMAVIARTSLAKIDLPEGE
jgi:hypothetical protein